MNTPNLTSSPYPAPRQAGVSLIIVLIMLVIIGLASAAAIRNATSGEKVTNNIRLENLAQQYAEAALRYCETELTKPDGNAPPNGRAGTPLLEANIQTVAIGGDALWSNADTWKGTGGAFATKTTLPESRVKSSVSAFKPAKMPECVAEKQTMADGKLAYVVTARGFSPDYAADATTGKTSNGSVVWLQSTILLE